MEVRGSGLREGGDHATWRCVDRGAHVVLPAPLGPMRHVIVPGLKVQLTSSRMRLFLTRAHHGRISTSWLSEVADSVTCGQPGCDEEEETSVTGRSVSAIMTEISSWQ